MRSIALLLLLLGIVAITIGYTKIKIKCPPPRIEYRYIPRSLLDEQLDSQTLKNVSDIFDNSDPWFLNDPLKHTLDENGHMVFATNQNFDVHDNFFSTKNVGVAPTPKRY